MTTTPERVPAGTTFRFLTLVGLAVAITAYVADNLTAFTVANQGVARLRCQVTSDLYVNAMIVIEPDEAKWRVYNDCLYRLRGTQLLWVGGFLLLLALVTWLFYVAQPRWRIRRGRLVPLREVPALWERLEPTLTELTRKAGLSTLPEFRLDARSTRAGGLAFGTHRRPIVALDVGLVLLHDRDRPAFEAVVLHELAHLRHRDVPITYGTIAVWRAVLLVAVLPFIVNLLAGVTLTAATWPYLVWFPVLIALAYVARLSVLRAREHHADVLVAQWTGSTDPFQTLPELSSPRFGNHPSRAARAAVTANPALLLRPGWRPFFLSGLMWQVLVNTVTMGAGMLWLRSESSGPAVLRWAWSLGVAVFVCVAAWRGAEYVRQGGNRRRAFLEPGLGLGAGLALGVLVVPSTLHDPLASQTSLLSLVLRLVGVAVAVLVCGWAGWCALQLGDRARGVRGAAVAAAVLVVCWSCLGWLPTAHGYELVWDSQLGPAVARLGDLAGGGFSGAVLQGAFLTFIGNTDPVASTIALALVWLVPALLVRPPRAAFLVGAAGSVAAALAVAVVAWPATSTPEGELAGTALQLLLVAVVQLGTALVARRAGVTAALIAAWLTALAGATAIWVAHGAVGGVDAILARRPTQVLLFTATAAAVLAALVGRRAIESRSVPRWALAPVAAASAVALVYHPFAVPPSVALMPPQPTVGVIDPVAAVEIWTQAGGIALLVDVSLAQNEAVQAMVDPAVDRGAQVARCRNLQARVGVAREFPGPPEPVARGHWNRNLDAVQRGADECVRLFSAPEGDPSPVTIAFEEAITEGTALLRLLPFGNGAIAHQGGNPPSTTTTTTTTTVVPTTTTPPPPVELGPSLLTLADLPAGTKENPPSTGGGGSSDIRLEPAECGTTIGPAAENQVERGFTLRDGATVRHTVYRYTGDAAAVLREVEANYTRCHKYRVISGTIVQNVTTDIVGGAPWIADVTYKGPYLTLRNRQVWVLKGSVLTCISYMSKGKVNVSLVDELAAKVVAKLA
ncbi:Zn-dependent protease with chaperone function [Actinokineospora baliensis]|uniref:M56 family metallopeptidase n=1 Tax=Actinokineospora baliensis TaxID=547056 RepID=UPI00195E74E5|nr:M56 family metallopeptidase [Actinokineospora baliensis]MBM7773240.1 Zn-dependent protease with chaperone function [Actinokineospora baliensis]